MKTKFLMCMLMALLAIGQVQANLVPNGDFQTMYKPGTGGTVTAMPPDGCYWSIPNMTVKGGGPVPYSDGTTGDSIETPGWVIGAGSKDNADCMIGGGWGGPDGSGDVAALCFASWGGPTYIETAAPLSLPAGSYMLSADIYHGGGPVVLELIDSGGTVVTPDAESTPALAANTWVEFTRSYNSLAGDYTVLVGTRQDDPLADPQWTGNRVSIDNVTLDFFSAKNPSPPDGAKVPVGDVDLSWTNLDPNVGDITYVDVWFGTEPNELHPGYDMTKIVTAGENTTTWTVSAPTAGTYYWQVVNYIKGPDHINEPNALVGPTWSFIAVEDTAPTVVIDTPAMMTWSGEPVPLNATVTDDGESALTYLWTADPADGVVFTPSAAVEDPTVTITKATANPSTVTLTVAVSDESNPTPNTDTMEIDVYDDACQLARLVLGLSAITDFDDNCITELIDLGVFTEAWLDNYAATGPLPAGGDPEDPVQTEPIPVPNGDFQTIVKPGTTIGATIADGDYFSIGNQTMHAGATAYYDDGTSGPGIELPGWVVAAGSNNNADCMQGGSWGGPDGAGDIAFLCFGTWGGPTVIESAAPLSAPAGIVIGDYTLSADVYYTARPVILKLLVDGVEQTPDTASSPAGITGWVEFTRTYKSVPAGDVTIRVGTRNEDGEGWEGTGIRASVDNITLEWVNPMNPTPANGATVPVGDVDLSWTNLDPNYPGHSVYVDVLFGTEPNELNPGYDMTKVVTAGENTTTVQVSAATEGTYYWQVNSYLYGPDHIDEPNMLEGSLWSFQAVADVPPTVEIDTLYQMTWFGEPVPLAATVTDDGTSALTYLWTADAPVGVNVGFDPGTAVEDPTVTITKVPYSNAQIVNAGFEADQQGEDGWGSAPGWTGSDGGSGNWNPPVGPDRGYNDGTVPEGNMCAWVEGTISQVLTETLAADTQYTLTVQVGNSLQYEWPSYNVQLVAGGTVLAEDPNLYVNVPLGEWALVTVPFDSTGVAAELVGQPLEIRLSSLKLYAADYSEINFDDVQLTANPPFPAPTGMQTITVTVAVSDAGNPTPDTDTIEIDVYSDACQMARMGQGLSAITDFDENCITDLRDYAVIAAAWLNDYSSTGPVPRP